MSGRFAEVWEFNRNPALAGTLLERTRVRDWFDRNVTHGTPLHRVLQAVDRKANSMGWHFYTITFVDDPVRNPWATSTRVGMVIYSDPLNVMGQDWFDFVVPHELGHVVGWNLCNPVDRSEEWAEEFRWWVGNGCPTGAVTQRLELT